MKRILFLSFIFLSMSLAIFAQKWREAPAGEIKLRDALEADETILKVECRIGSGRYDDEASVRREATRIRLLVYEASLSKDKTAKIKQICHSVEGMPTATYLLVENGKFKFIIDTSRDRIGYMRVLSYDCSKLSIGTYAFDTKTSAMLFTPVAKPSDPGENIPYFQCLSRKKEFIF